MLEGMNACATAAAEPSMHSHHCRSMPAAESCASTSAALLRFLVREPIIDSAFGLGGASGPFAAAVCALTPAMSLHTTSGSQTSTCHITSCNSQHRQHYCYFSARGLETDCKLFNPGYASQATGTCNHSPTLQTLVSRWPCNAESFKLSSATIQAVAPF